MSGYYLHRKTGGIYRVLAQEYVHGHYSKGAQIWPVYASGEAMAAPFTVTDDFEAGNLMVFYVDAVKGTRHARAFKLFGDGRFTAFENPPALLTPAPESSHDR